MPGRYLVMIAVAAAACGGGGAVGPDAAPDGAPGGECTEAETFATFRVVPEPGASARWGTQVSGEVLARPYPELLATIAEDAGCRYVAPSPVLCTPACTGAALCDIHGACVDYPANLATGTLSLTGSTPAITLEPWPGSMGSYTATELYPGLFGAGDALTLDVEGGGGADPINLATIGVPVIALPTRDVVAREHEAMVIAWTPLTGVDGAEVMVHMDNDHHGLRAYVECVAPADAGSLTVPAAILDRLILAGETGIGTYIENAWIEQRRRTTARSARGCAVFQSHSDDFLSVETIRAP